MWLLIDLYNQNVIDPRLKCQQLVTQDTKVGASGLNYQMSVTLTSAVKDVENNEFYRIMWMLKVKENPLL